MNSGGSVRHTVWWARGWGTLPGIQQCLRVKALRRKKERAQCVYIRIRTGKLAFRIHLWGSRYRKVGNTKVWLHAPSIISNITYNKDEEHVVLTCAKSNIWVRSDMWSRRHELSWSVTTFFPFEASHFSCCLKNGQRQQQQGTVNKGSTKTTLVGYDGHTRNMIWELWSLCAVYT